MPLVGKHELASLRPAAAGCVAALCFAAAAFAATPFAGLVGSWSGSGQVRYEDGQFEGIRCTAYYSEVSQKLRLAIRCRSASSEIEIRGLLAQRGDRLTGTWEERTFNVSGEAAGRLAGGRMTLSIAGGAFSGSMSVSYGGTRQVVTIATTGIPMKSVNITLGRS